MPICSIQESILSVTVPRAPVTISTIVTFFIIIIFIIIIIIIINLREQW